MTIFLIWIDADPFRILIYNDFLKNKIKENRMKVLVIGGSGFLGSHVADELSSYGHEVTIFDRSHSQYIRSDQKMVVGDIVDRNIIDAAIKNNEVVYHFAAIADIEEAAQNPFKTVNTNILGTLNILESAKKNNVKRFVLASSIYVYSDQGSIYRTTKQTCENLVENYRELYNLNFTILRFGSLYGPRADEKNTVFRMISSALDKKEIIYNGTGEELREYIHVKDGAAAAVEILDKEFKNSIIHLMGQEKMTTSQMMAMITEILGGEIKISTNSKQISGHYFQTPYSFSPKLGQKLIRKKYIDIGLGLLDLIEYKDIQNSNQN